MALKNRLLFVLISTLLLFLAFNRHNSGYFNYHSILWADKSGYYVYLPAVLKYDLSPKGFPKDIDIKTGTGFSLDFENNKVKTKYTCGVAIMQLPFYLLADNFASVIGQKADGFSPIYHWSINVAAVFYVLFGLIFLKKYLQKRFSIKATYLVLISIFLGTNLYFFSMDEGGMSHVYSFFLFSLYLYHLQKTNYLEEWKITSSLIFGIIAGLIILIRPTNLIFLSGFFFLDIDNTRQIWERIKRIFLSKSTLFIVLSAGLMLLPQLLYWNYLHGTPIYYSYGDEGFNWLKPQLHATWFAPNNGLLLYTPLFFVILFAMVYAIKTKRKNGVLVFSIFILLSYVLSCWWIWSFGCSLGARNYVEYYALFALPLANFYQRILKFSWQKATGLWAVISLLVLFNLKLTYTFDECFQCDPSKVASCDWNWDEYIRLVVSRPK